ncbi:transglycosylase SLT domain-containing protein [Vibrio metschnikovii]|nr:transglycosylase SLT domain-containing protein [Vibrio metschnikovii]
MKCKAFFLSIIFCLVASPQVSASYVTVPNYFVSISNKTSVPADILYALAAKETNVKMNNGTVAPWPFTLNVNGKGYWYASYEDMMAATHEFLNEGITSIDIGLFQVNWLWNGHRVQSIEELGEPKKNGLVAAQILLEHYQKHRDWAVAAGRYHNPANRDGRADRYAKEFSEFLTLIQRGQYQQR